MNKRVIILIAVFVLLLGVIGTLLALAVKKQHAAQTPTPVQAVIKKVLDEKVISPVPSFDNSALWYFNTDGRLFRVNLDGTGLSEFPLPALTGTIKSVLWPSSGSDFLAIMTTTDGSEVKSYYDSTQKIYTSLPANIRSIDWLPDGKRVAYIWQSGDNKTQSLVTANADGTGFQTISNVFWPDLVVKASPDGKSVLLYRNNPASDVNKIYKTDLTTGQINTAVDSGKNLSAMWLASGQFVFAQQGPTPYPKLYVYDPATKASIDLNLSTDLNKITADKAGKFLYAAVPAADGTGDAFVKLDLNTYQEQALLPAQTGVRATNLMLIGDTSLYFTNLSDGKLYTIGQ